MGVEEVERDRLRTKLSYALGVPGRRERADDLVTGLDQLGNEAAADRTARSDDEDSHRVPSFSGAVRAG